MILAQGFLKDLLLTQLKGLTGHISEAGYPFDRISWDDEVPFQSENQYPTWWVYEQTAYWLDGYLRCGIALGDEKVIAEASRIIHKVIERQKPDGFLGPETMRGNRGDRWPYVVFFRACLALYGYEKDPSIVKALARYYLECPLDYDVFRDVINVEIILDLYGILKDERLLKKAQEIYEKCNENPNPYFNEMSPKTILSRKRPHCHGVTYNEYSKLPGLFWKYTEDPFQKKLAVRAMDRLVKEYLLPGQCNCSDEQLWSDYYMECYETCDISDFTWANERMLDALKFQRFGDRVEKCVFNAGMGSVLENFKGLQYFSCANQFLADSHSTHCKFSKGKKWMSYRPNPGTECCAGNVNRFVPNYVLNMFKEDSDGVWAYLYGPAEFVSDDGKIRIEEKTVFPFEERIVFSIKTARPFTLFLRRPGYGTGYRILEDGREVETDDRADFFKVKVLSDCEIVFTFEAAVKAVEVRGGGLYIERGPLVYSFGQFGDRRIDADEERSSTEFPAYDIYPTEDWGYEVCREKLNAVYKQGTSSLFDLREDLPSVTIDAYKVKDCRLERLSRIYRIYKHLDGKVERFFEKGDFVLTPDLLKGSHETEKKPVRLVLKPYGACKLRETVFKIKE